MALTLTVPEDILFWDGPDTTYNVYGIAWSNTYSYASNISAHSTNIWRPTTPGWTADNFYFVVSSTDLTVSGSISYRFSSAKYDNPCNPFVYTQDYQLGEEQRIQDKRYVLSKPEILTSTGHRFASNADRISVLRRKIFECSNP